jgi:hypothetical protein
VSGDRESLGADVHVEAKRDARGDGRLVATPRITVQVIGLEPQHVRVIERPHQCARAGRLRRPGWRRVQSDPGGPALSASASDREIALRLAELEEVHREEAGQ